MAFKKEYSYAILDVFTDEPLKGNPLAVVLQADGLSDDIMQSLAREFNLSETVFVCPPKKDKNDAFLRIFTPFSELPFAGHPTVGTAVLLACHSLGDVTLPTDKTIQLEEKIGSIRCGVVVKPEGGGHATFALPQLSEKVGSCDSHFHLAEALGLKESDIGFDAYEPGIYSAGTSFTLVPVKSLEAIQRIKPCQEKWAQAFEVTGRDNAFVFTRGGEDERAAFHARMFWPNAGIVEDAATGSAVAAFSKAILDFEKLQDGHHSFLIEQGFEIGRPSRILLEIDIEEGAVLDVRIGGNAVILCKGTLYL